MTESMTDCMTKSMTRKLARLSPIMTKIDEITHERRQEMKDYTDTNAAEILQRMTHPQNAPIKAQQTPTTDNKPKRPAAPKSTDFEALHKDILDARLSIRTKTATVDKLRIIAERHNLTLNQVINAILENYSEKG